MIARFARQLSTRAAQIGLRVPSSVVCGSPADVQRVLPLLHELSAGAQRGTPRWAESKKKEGGKKRSESWLEITYPFSTDANLRELYMLADGESLRAGRFLEELDAFSADCAKRHAEAEIGELAVVTAAHDGLHMFDSLSAVHDFRLRGAVTIVGSSSMEVRTDVLQVEGGSEVLLGSCFTVMVARDAATFDKVSVPALRGGDANSAAEEQEALLRSRKRRALSEQALNIQPPTPSEVPLLHELWRHASARETRGRKDADACAAASQVPMVASEQRSLDIMQPTHRNQNGYMFGGYLMRRALEVAWLSAFKHGRRPLRFGGLDDVTFSKPVVVGKIVEFVGRVAFVAPDGRTLRVFVEAEHVSLRTGRREATCDFHFVFLCNGADGDAEDCPPAPQVEPVTYEETLLFLEGRRRWVAGNL